MSFTGSMFGDIIEWFLGRAGDRRQYKRRAGAFHLWYQPDPADAKNLKQGIGLELSPNGIMFIVPDPISAREFNLTVRVREANIPLRVRHVRNDQIQHQGKTWNRYMGEFTGVAADHWDAIVRYVNDEPEVDRRKMQNQEPNDRVDDAYRLLPMALQQKIIDMLVSQNKLEPPKAGQTPLLKLFYGGLVKRAGGKPGHRFNVHSRVKKNDEMVAYDTRFIIGEDGEIVLV
ncbi:MAG TPA: hypothetical protein VNF68_12090 [Candidatus Baltobacteraceae bacterium]|nr:hypothetical protein [Candidatus Baltobacteraceae bacterium]